MPDDEANPDTNEGAKPADQKAEQNASGDAAEPTGPLGWSAVWQAPALLFAVALLVSGLYAAVASRPAPDFESIIRRGEALVQRERYQDAIDELNETFFPFYDEPIVADSQRQRYHLVIARSIYNAQRLLGIRVQDNDRAVLREFLEAERLEATLRPLDVYALAETLIRLDQTDRALRRAEDLPMDRSDLRHRLLRQFVEHELSRREPGYDIVLDQLARLLAEPELPRNERIWAVEQQAEVNLRQGYPRQVVDRILRAMPRLTGAGEERDLLPLYVMLGQAYTEIGLLDQAWKRLDRAAVLADGVGQHWGRIQFLMGRIDADLGRAREARDRHADIVRNHGRSDDLLPNLLALAETEATLGRTDASVAAYDRLADELPRSEPHPMATREQAAESLMDRFRERFSSGQTADARRFATIAERLWGVDDAPRDVLLALAESNRRLADEALPPRTEGTPRLTDEELDPATREQIKPLLIAAGAYFRAHADRSDVTDNTAFGDSLWASAQAFDRAGQQQDAIEAYRVFADGAADSPRWGEARFRLAQAYHARGEHTRAEGLLRDLIASGLDRIGDKGVGIWADRSYVPLAQTLLMDDIDVNDDEAARLLVAVVDGRRASPDAEQYPTALFELGRYHYQQDDFPRAIERLEEFRERFPDHPDAGRVLFWLADAFRLESDAIEETLAGALPDSQREQLEDARSDRLERAGVLFDQVVEVLGGMDARRRTDLENVYLRNAHYYRGDCAFDLGRYDEAIRHYDAARLAYRGDPAALVAMVQIVNAHVAQGNTERARTANERARRFFEQLPDTVWDDPTLPMGRDDWERWLDSSSRLYALDRAE